MSQRGDDRLSRVIEVLGRAEAASNAFEKAADLHCPPSCGQCCLQPTVETTVLEMLPMAEMLVASGAGEEWLDIASNPSDPRRCVVYRPDPVDPRRGRCGFYSSRPALCRLFGFAAQREKSGLPRLAACVVHKEKAEGGVERAIKLIASGHEVPIFAEFAMEIRGIDPGLGTELLPINRALALALSRVLFRQALDRSTSSAARSAGVPPAFPKNRHDPQQPSQR